MSKDQVEISNINNFLKFFRLSLTNAKIYPITSPLVERQINEFYNFLKQILRDTTNITLSEVDGKIFINDEEYHGKDSISITNLEYLDQFFIQTGIKSITFKRELLLEELKDFIIALTIKKPGTSPKETIKKLSKKNIKNITIDEVEYITILKSDKNIKSIIHIISQPISNFTELMNILNTALYELEKIQNEETKKRISSIIAKQLATLDTHLLCELLTSPLPLKFEELDLKNSIINLTKRNLEEIFSEIITWCKKLKTQAENEAEYIKQLQNFKSFIPFVLNSSVSEILPIELFEELFKIGLIDALPETIKQKKEEQKSWIAQLDEILETKQPEKLLQEKFLSILQENIEKLCSIGLDDKIEHIINLMSENLSNPVVKIRYLLASSLVDISNQLKKNDKSRIAKNLINKILNFLLKEKEETIIQQYLFSLESLLICLINCKDYDSFNNFPKQLLLIAEETQKIEIYKSKSIYSLIDKIFDKTKEKILNHLIQEIDQKITNNIIWFLNYIAERSFETIMEVIFNTSNQEIIYKLYDLIISIRNKQMILDSILAYLTPATSQHKLSKIIVLIEKIDYDFSEPLKQIYPYMGYANKIAIINCLQLKPKEENLNWLSSLLDKEEPQVAGYIVKILTSLKYKKSSDKILRLLKTKNKDLKKTCLYSIRRNERNKSY